MEGKSKTLIGLKAYKNREYALNVSLYAIHHTAYAVSVGVCTLDRQDVCEPLACRHVCCLPAISCGATQCKLSHRTQPQSTSTLTQKSSKSWNPLTISKKVREQTLAKGMLCSSTRSSNVPYVILTRVLYQRCLFQAYLETSFKGPSINLHSHPKTAASPNPYSFVTIPILHCLRMPFFFYPHFVHLLSSYPSSL